MLSEQIVIRVQNQHLKTYCESILFRGAEISSFEDDAYVRGYLTSWIAIPTKLKNTKLLPLIFDRCKTEAYH